MKRILVVAPHADDEVLGCGGLIAKRAQAGDWVHVAVLGIGGLQHRGQEQAMAVAGRQAELGLAAERLLVSRTTVLYPGMDMRLDTLPMVEIVTALDGLLDELEYDEVYLPYASVNHDHQVVYRAMLAALRPAVGRKLPGLAAAYEYALTGWQLDAVPGGRLYVDIEQSLPMKCAALLAYQSQLREAPHPCSVKSVQALARFRGLESGLEAAEMFYLLRVIER